MRKNYGNNYTVEIDGNVVTYNIWMDGVAYGALLASQGADAYLKMWNEMLDGISSMASSIQKYYDETCKESVIVAVNVVNDANKENVLATVLSGLVVYDSVNNTNFIQ